MFKVFINGIIIKENSKVMKENVEDPVVQVIIRNEVDRD